MKIRWIAFVFAAFGHLYAASAAGHYYLRGVMEVGSELLLKPDGEFEYMLAYGSADYASKGKWHQEKGYVVLNTEAPEEDPFRLVRSSASKSPAFRVWIKTPQGRPVPHIEVVVDEDDGSRTAQTDDEGVAVFGNVKRPRAIRINVRVYRLEAGPFPVEKGKSDFEFEINGPAITTVRFKNEKLKQNGGTLEMLFWNPEHPMNYVRE